MKIALIEASYHVARKAGENMLKKDKLLLLTLTEKILCRKTKTLKGICILGFPFRTQNVFKEIGIAFS